MSDSEVRGRILLGSGRSGTTWVQDCLAEANGLRPIFEPLHEEESRLGERYAYDVLQPRDSCEPLESFFADLAAGRVRSRWTDLRGRTGLLFPSPFALGKPGALRSLAFKWRKYLRERSRLRLAARRPQTLIKCIRANLMAGWFVHALGFRTVLMVRHPCAVVESQYRIGAAWDPVRVADRYRQNERLHEITNGRYLRLLNSKLTTIEALTLNWVIENQHPVQVAASGGYPVVHYEHLMQVGRASWATLAQALALSTVPDSGLLSRPSQQSSTATGQRRHSAGPRWRAGLDAGQQGKIQGILDATECGMYSVGLDDPVHEGQMHLAE